MVRKTVNKEATLKVIAEIVSRFAKTERTLAKLSDELQELGGLIAYLESAITQNEL